MHVPSYLERIGYEGSGTPSPETLRDLHVAHLRAVPFENLDISLGRPIHLDPARLFDKIVTRRRGGFCYELNGLFAHLLRALGFDVTLLSGRVVSDGVVGPEFDHMLLLVDGDEPVIADVGFGDSFVAPLALHEREQPEGERVFRLRREDDRWHLERRERDGAFEPQYLFSCEPRTFADFLPMCEHQQTSPESVFTRKTVCSLATSEGRTTYANGREVITTKGRREERAVPDAGALRRLLRERFGVELDPGDCERLLARPVRTD